MIFLIILFWLDRSNIINEYQKAIQIEVNPSKSYETSIRIILKSLSKFGL
jgi:hypothetical protein